MSLIFKIDLLVSKHVYLSIWMSWVLLVINNMAAYCWSYARSQQRSSFPKSIVPTTHLWAITLVFRFLRIQKFLLISSPRLKISQRLVTFYFTMRSNSTYKGARNTGQELRWNSMGLLGYLFNRPAEYWNHANMCSGTWARWLRRIGYRRPYRGSCGGDALPGGDS